MATDAKEPGPKNDERPSDVTLEQRAKDAAKKAAEYGGYLQLMEERVASLELKLQPPQEEAAAKKAGSSSKSSSKRVPAIPELHLVKWAEFKNKLKDDDKIYAIEALVGEVKYWYQKETQIHPNLLEENGIRKDSSNQKELVKRIRINSLPILTILSDVTDYEWVLEPIVLIYPFKLLVERDGAIREQMKRLEIKWGSTDNEAAGVGAGTSLHNSPNPGATTVARGEESSQITPNGIGSKTMDARKENTAKIKDDNEPNSTQNESRKKEKEDLMDSLETLRDMRCLIKFMDEQIAPVVARINDRSCTRISFHDLWHLFRPGDYIFVPRHSPRDRPSDPSDQPAGESPQTTHKRNDRYQEDWRILGCGGGRPNLISASDEDSVVPKHKVNPFEVSTYYVDFNGKVFGATTRWFQIKPFDGEREITSLEFYPSRFVRNAEARRAELKTRGEKFRGYRTFQHQQYKGMTFACQPCGTEFSEDKTNPEPIDSQVVVDFAEAIRDDYDWHPEGREFDTSCAFSREVDDDAALNVDYLQPVSEYTGGWEDLKLVAGHKEMLKALVRTHLRDKQTMLKGDEDEKHSHDIVRGKARKNNMMKADREEILAFAKKQYTDGKKTDSNWNGRQIRNAFQTAAALAEYDAQVKYQDPNGPVYSRLHSDHFNTVLQASRQFDDYIKSVRGETAEDRAHLQRLRDDLFKSTAIDYRGPETHSKSKSAKGQKLRQPQDEYDDEAEFEEEEAPPQVLAPAPTSKRLLRSREPPQDTYSPREVSQSQAPGTQRLRQPPARPTQLQTNAAPRSKRSSNHGYPTPSTSNSALHEQMEPGDTYYAPRGAAIEAKRRPPANQRLVGRNAAVNVRQPEPEVESEEPDYSDDDDEDDNME
ncbi:hypothetical protein P7C71_g4245, partial [Lecanoromycetidae sp. Uapishka_2]